MGSENLIKNEDLTPEQRRESARKAGKASAVARHEKKQLKSLAQAMLSCAANEENTQTLKKLFPDLAIDEITVGAVLLAKQIDEATNGNTRAFESIRDTSGQKPVDKQDINQTVKTDDFTLAGIRELFEAAVAAKSNSTKPDIKLDKPSKA